ncbi:hypothetical protein C8R47DRAFT_1276561 [Mycena vitilis]|nr:hypothetical protein C8R47DRAFT_1276561 [Mycena vitilis]
MPPKKKRKDEDDAVAPRKAGRPRKTFIKRGKAAVTSSFNALVKAMSPPPQSLDAATTSLGGTVLTGDAARAALLAAQSYGTRPERQEPKHLPVFLDKISHEDHKLIATIPTEDCPRWFDKQLNDYLTKGPFLSESVEIKWFGHPGDSGGDIRARRFIVRWSKALSDPTLKLRTDAVARGKPVLRWKYYCAGVHDRDIGDDVDPGSKPKSTHGSSTHSSPVPPPSASSSTASLDSSAPHDHGPDRWNKCQGQVRLYCEITADDLSHIKIWQTGDHTDAPPHFPFTFSRHLRLLILEWMRRYGAKASAVNRDLVSQFERRDASSGEAEPLPSHRLPTLKQIRQMLPAVRHRTRLDRNPFRATHLMVHRNPDTMYYYEPHDFSKPDEESKFKVAITDAFSTDSMILNGTGSNGVLFMDSTHRLHNENRAATTVLCTANSDKHMMPGAYLISANIKARTLEGWLLETIKKIEARAKEIVADKSTIKHRTPAERDEIYAIALDIVKNGFNFTGLMMDKSGTELKAVLAVIKKLGFKDAYIRLCQFHVIQAILNFDADSGRRGIGFTLSYEVKFDICVLFRRLQRCRTWEAWPETEGKFYADLQALLTVADVAEESSDDGSDEDEAAESKENAAAETKKDKVRPPKKPKPAPKPKTKAAKTSGFSCFETVKAYFAKNWFTSRWIPYFTDIGMPSTTSRDGVWNTNNWAETAFKQFNTTFLDNKHNKRIDRLASIILNDHLPYFRYFATPNRPEAQEVREMNLDAHTLWENDMVQDVSTTVLAQRYTIARVVNAIPVQYTVTLDPLSCDSRLLRSNGSVAKWLDAEAKTEATAVKVDKAAHSRMRDDATVEKELLVILERLAKKLQEDSDKAPGLGMDFGDSRVVNSGGRPRKIQSLRPWRRLNRAIKYATAGNYTHSPRFIKKRGPPKMRRLAWSSLFPATHRLVNARRAAWLRQLLKGKVKPKEKALSPAFSFKPPPNDDDQFLNSEDLSLGLFGFNRWVPPTYEARMDEMDIFTALLNNSIFAEQRGILFFYGAPHIPRSDELRKLDWTQPLSIDMLREMKLEHLADLLETRTNRSITQLVFFRLLDHHWTVFHHLLNVADAPPVVRWFNSLPAPPVVALEDVQDQFLFQQYFVQPRRAAPPPPMPWHSYTPVYLNLQHDAYSCGFWAVYVAFAILLGFNPDNTYAHELDAAAIKELTGTAYASFVGDQVGVPMDLIRELFGRFEPSVLNLPMSGDSMMARRPANIARATVTEPPTETPDAAPSRGQSKPVATPHDPKLPPGAGASNTSVQPGLAEDFHELIDAEGNNSGQWALGNTVVSTRHLTNLVGGGLTADGIVDGYLWCYVLCQRQP